jgi:hypothetical protein
MANPAAPLEGAPAHLLGLVLISISDTARRQRVVVVQIAGGQASF